MEAVREDVLEGGGSFLSGDLVRQLVAVGQVDVLVGIPTFNNAATVAQVVQGVEEGFARYFPRERTVLVTADGGSTDGTMDIVRNAGPERLAAPRSLRTLQRIVAPYTGIAGRAGAVRTILASAELLGARACAIIGADLTSFTPEWVTRLIRPVFQDGYDLVAPLYRRHKYDGMLMKLVAYPILRGVYCRRVREPLGGEFGLSSRLASYYLAQEVWHTDLTRLNVDFWMVGEAIARDHRVAQSVLGPKLLAHRDSAKSLATILHQVVGTLFTCLELHEEHWKVCRESEEVPALGDEYEATVEPVRVNSKRMLAQFRAGISELAPILEPILSPETSSRVKEIAAQEDRSFRFPDDLWARSVYEFAVAFHRSVIHRDHVVKALLPLYLGKVCSFVLETRHSRPDRIERRLEEIALAFERQREDLLERWTAPAEETKTSTSLPSSAG